MGWVGRSGTDNEKLVRGDRRRRTQFGRYRIRRIAGTGLYHVHEGLRLIDPAQSEWLMRKAGRLVRSIDLDPNQFLLTIIGNNATARDESGYQTIRALVVASAEEATALNKFHKDANMAILPFHCDERRQKNKR